MSKSKTADKSATRRAPTLLVTGATGNIGSELAQLLAARRVPFRAMVRALNEPPARTLAALPGVEVVAGDFNDAASVATALVGIERAFLLTNSTAQAETQQFAFVELARQAGVRHLVKQSQWAVAAGSPVRFLRHHAAFEAAIRASGLAYTFLRPNLFMQALLGFKMSIAEQGKFFAAIGEVRISAVDVRNIAAAAAAALTEPGHENRVYELTGPAALTHAELAAGLAAALHRPVAFMDVPPAAMHDALLGLGMDAWQAEGVIEDYVHYHRGEAATVAAGVHEATGQAPREFAAFARDYAPAFQ